MELAYTTARCVDDSISVFQNDSGLLVLAPNSYGESMAFLVQPGQLVNMVYGSSLPPTANFSYVKFVISPGQPLPGFPIEHLATDFPTGFANPSGNPCYFDLDGFLYTPPPWNPSGWFRMIHKVFAVISPTEWKYSWNDTHIPLHWITVSVS